MRLDRLTAEDALVLSREDGAVCGHTCKVLILERTGDRPLPTLEQLRRRVDARLDAAPRLRRRLVETPLRVASPAWLDDPAFDIARHITQVRTPAPVSRDGLEEIVGRLMTRRLDRARPLWHLDLVELEHESLALVWRIHHCMADGATSVRLGAAVLWDDDPGAPPPALAPWTPVAGPGPVGLFALGIRDRAHHARRRRESVRRNGRPGGSRLSSRVVLSRELSREADLTPLAASAGSSRRVAFATAPLAQCRRAGKAIDPSVTLNDVVLAIVAGGVRTWLEHVSGAEATIRVKVPVSLHGSGEDDVVGNRDSYFFVDLPVDEGDPAARVLAVSRETRERKLGHDAETLYHLGRNPLVARWAMSPRVFTFNVSNVRGPAGEIYVGGARVGEVYSLAEIAQQHALRVAVISAAGSLFFGLNADRDAVVELQAMIDGMRRSVEELLALVAQGRGG
jgi:diacylglycerol O-acyltransferase